MIQSSQKKATVQLECDHRLHLNAFSTRRNGQSKEGRIYLHNFKEETVEKEIGREAKEHVQHNLHLP